MSDEVQIGSLRLKFLIDDAENGGKLTMFDMTVPEQARYRRLRAFVVLPGGGINAPFTSVGDIDAWKWKRVGLRMDDTSGKFALVVLRAKQVRVHHKRTKHEYVFRISDNRIEVAECLLHPNHAAPVDPRDYREEAQAAAEWFVEKRSRVSANILDDQPRSGWVAA
jgi:hypothetical protein